jgi:cell division protease FtsH
MMVMLYNLFNQQQLAQNDISYSEFLAMVEADRVAEVTIQGQELRDGPQPQPFQDLRAPGSGFNQRLKDKGVTINAKPPAESPGTCPCWSPGSP